MPKIITPAMIETQANALATEFEASPQEARDLLESWAEELNAERKEAAEKEAAATEPDKG